MITLVTHNLVLEVVLLIYNYYKKI